MSDLENEEVNHQLCTVAVDEMFDSWSLEIQEQVMAEWNDWRQDVATEAGLCCDECGRVFTRPDNLKRHIQIFNPTILEKSCSLAKNVANSLLRKIN
jgi:hypothetical protein